LENSNGNEESSNEKAPSTKSGEARVDQYGA